MLDIVGSFWDVARKGMNLDPAPGCLAVPKPVRGSSFLQAGSMMRDVGQFQQTSTYLGFSIQFVFFFF